MLKDQIVFKWLYLGWFGYFGEEQLNKNIVKNIEVSIKMFEAQEGWAKSIFTETEFNYYVNILKNLGNYVSINH